MSQNFSVLFVNAVTAVMRDYSIQILTSFDPSPAKNKFIETKGMDVLIYLTEEVEGIFVLSMATETAIELARRIDMDPASVNEEIAREIVAEIGNMIAARASAFFSKASIKTNITPPSIFCGRGSRIFCPVPNLMVSSFVLDIGEICVHSAVRQKDKQIVYV